MKSIVTFILSVLILLSSNNSFSQSRLDNAKSDVKSGGKNSGSGGSASSSASGESLLSSSDDSDSDLSADDVALGAQLFFGLMKGVAIITYYTTIGDYEDEDHLYNELTPYPLANHRSGNYLSYDSTVVSPKIRFDIHERVMFLESNLYGNRFDVDFRPFNYFYLHGGYTQLAEYIKEDDRYSYLALARFDLGYDRLRFERFNLGWSIGLTYIPNEINMTGFSFGLKSEVFVISNISINASAKWSAVNHTPVNEYAIQGRYHIGRGYIGAGYEHLTIGKPSFSFVTLGGGIYF